jgi:hypothetical protein
LKKGNVMQEFSTEEFLKELNQATLDNNDYKLIREKLLESLEELLITKKVQNKGLNLGVGTLLLARSLIEISVPNDDERRSLYSQILFKS